MTPVHMKTQYPSQEEAPFHAPPQLDAAAPPIPGSRPLSYAFPQYDASSPSPTSPKKKRSHGKARASGHIPRPPNAFIIFRTEYIKSMATHSTPEMSKNLGELWKNMSKLEQQPWAEKAREAKEEHMRKYPNYKYKPVHPRDAEGKCIRKPRKPNQSRAKKGTVANAAAADDDDFSFSRPFAWLEAHPEYEFPNVSLPSDSSAASSPPLAAPSPPLSASPAPSAALSPSSLLPFRRSSSVPLPDSDGRLAFGLPFETAFSAHPLSAGGSSSHGAPRIAARRPSTSMDFVCAGDVHAPPYDHNPFPFPPGPGEFAQWRAGHRRSISAPILCVDVPAAQLAQQTQGQQHFSQDVENLQPIHPAFDNVFAKFSWEQTSSLQYQNAVTPQASYQGFDIPPMTTSPLSNGSTASPATTPNVQSSYALAIQHPTPLPALDFSAFHEQVDETGGGGGGGYPPPPPPHDHHDHHQLHVDNALGLSERSHQAEQQQQQQQQQQHQQLYVSVVGGQTLDVNNLPIYPVENAHGPPNMLQDCLAIPPPLPPPPPPAATDVSAYGAGLSHHHIHHPQESLAFDELIVESYGDYRHAPS